MDPLSTETCRAEPLERFPALLVAIPSLSLLIGQASVSFAWFFLSFLCFVFLIAALSLGWMGKRKWALLFLFSGAAFAVGYLTHHRLINPELPGHHLLHRSGGKKPLLVEGLFYREPERRSGRTRWHIKAERIWLPVGSQETEGNILVSVGRAEREWRYGDRVRLRLKVRSPHRAGNPGQFDYSSYLARRRIYLTGFLKSDAETEMIRREAGGARRWIEVLRRRIRRFIDDQLPPGEGALLKALVVGDRGGVSGEAHERFSAAGVAHILSISGLHVGMLGLIVFVIVRFLGSFSTTLMLRWNLFKVSAFLAFLAVLFYTALAGARVPTVRASIMVGVYTLAVLIDREEEFYSSLALAALIIGLIWPGAILDVSFQLSFLAVLFIVWGLRTLQKLELLRERDEMLADHGWFRPRLRQLILYLAVPILATVGTGPMVGYHFGRLSLAGFFSNPIVVPLVGFLVVPPGFLIGFLCLFSATLALPLVWLATPVLSLILVLVRFFSGLPMAHVPVPTLTLFELGLLYLVLCSVLMIRRRLHVYLFSLFLLIAVAVDGGYWFRQRWNRKDLRVTYLSVGHGDAAVVEFPGSRVLLIDAGGSPGRGFDPGRSIVAPFLRSRRITKVDYLVVSHPGVDHYGGMEAILEEFAPSELWAAPNRGGAGRYRALLGEVEARGIRRLFPTRREPCRSIGKVRLCFLYPPEDGPREASLVLSISLGRHRFLFPGDIRKSDEERVLRSGAELSSEVLKVPRHGSRSSSTEAFVGAVSPKLAVFSVGRGNRFGLPSREVVSRYLDRGAAVVRTDRDGAITVETDGERIRYRTYLSGRTGDIGG